VVFVDSRARLGKYAHVIAKPNLGELFRAVGRPAADELELQIDAARALQERTGMPVFVTRADRGVLIVDDAETAVVPAVPVAGPIDVVGAGDAAMSGIVAALCSGASPVAAAQLGCLVASITIQQLGVTGTARPDQVRARFADHQP
jgi:sugar/nucleoside kinase (ribokinase family)